MFNKFQGEISLGKYGKYINLKPILPKKANAFFLIDKNARKSKEEIFKFLDEQGIKTEKICKLKQIHSNIIVKEEDGAEADGIFTTTPKIAVSIAVADCVPILISANKGKTIIALHSGWKGTFLKIAQKSASLFDANDCDAVWIGPSIRSCCYNVSSERIESFKKEFPKSKNIFIDESKLDLPLINAEILSTLGIPEEKIYLDGRCSACSKEGFASFRRDKENAGRMALVAVSK